MLSSIRGQLHGKQLLISCCKITIKKSAKNSKDNVLQLNKLLALVKRYSKELWTLLQREHAVIMKSNGNWESKVRFSCVLRCDWARNSLRNSCRGGRECNKADDQSRIVRTKQSKQSESRDFWVHFRKSGFLNAWFIGINVWERTWAIRCTKKHSVERDGMWSYVKYFRFCNLCALKRHRGKS